jgi:uncharacterized RDD family membrane protein YckC
MKCPKCGYIGFESVDKCRNCGYNFSLAEPSDAPFDLPLRTEEPVEAPRDIPFSIDGFPTRPPAPRARPRLDSLDEGPARDDARDLPLFGGDEAALPSRPPRVATLASRAAAVPRRPPAGPRPQALPIDLPLDLDAALESVSASRGRPSSGGRAAGSIARAIAALIDLVILLSLDAGVLYFTLRVCRLSFGEIGVVPLAPLIAFFLLVNGGYLVGFTAWGGQTIGKMAASIKVIAEDGLEVVPSQALVRAFGYFASLLPAGLGFVPGLVGPSRRALHDRLANTRVVRLR